MSFKQFGGLNYAAKNNIIGNLYSNSGNLGIITSLGQDNSKIVCQSHLDLSGNSLLHTGSIYFMDGTVQTTAFQTDPTDGSAIFKNGINVYKFAHIYGTLDVSNNTTLNGTLLANSDASFNNSVFINGTLDVSNNTTLHGTLLANSDASFNSSVYIKDTLDVSGSIIVTGSVTASSFYSTSDYRIKDNVQLLNISHSVDDLRPVTYWNKHTKNQDIGFIAHEVQEVLPYLVSGKKDSEEMQTLNYIGLIGILTKEIQELKKRVKELEDKNYKTNKKI